jgi:LPS-assembly protein
VDFRPLPWVSLTVDSQLPVFNGNKGFYDVDSALNFQVTSNLQLNLSDRYLDHNPFFQNSNLVSVGAYYRLNDNWAAAFSERYEFAQHQLQAQSYTVYRDLSSFVAALGFTVRDNDGIDDYGLLLSFTLKGVPKVNLPVGFDVNSVLNEGTAP